MKAAAYVLAAILFWPKARLTGFTCCEDWTANLEVRNSALTERARGIMNENPAKHGRKRREAEDKKVLMEVAMEDGMLQEHARAKFLERSSIFSESGKRDLLAAPAAATITFSDLQDEHLFPLRQLLLYCRSPLPAWVKVSAICLSPVSAC